MIYDEEIEQQNTYTHQKQQICWSIELFTGKYVEYIHR